MAKVHLGFKAFDIHELLTHFVAQTAGYYQQQALDVSLLDFTFIPDEQLPANTFHAACGAALLNYVSGKPYKVLFVNTDYPMFWLYSVDGTIELSKLTHARIASYPGLAPPSHFLAAVTTGMDVSLLPVSSDIARLGMLRNKAVDAALISSAFPPAVMEERGFHNPLLIGEKLRVPTTGLAIDAQLQTENPDLVQQMVSAHQQSLSSIHNDDDLLKAVLTNNFSLPASTLNKTITLIRQLFTQDGRSTPEIEQQAISTVAERFNSQNNLPSSTLYDYSFLQ